MALKYCPECGNKLPEKAKFCPDCGYKLEIPDETPITPEPEVIEPEVVEEPEITQSRPPIDMVEVKNVKQSKIKSWKVVCIGVVVLIAILCVVFIPKRKEESVSITQASTENVASTETIKEIETTVTEKEKLILKTVTVGDVVYTVPEDFIVSETVGEPDTENYAIEYRGDDSRFSIHIAKISGVDTLEYADLHEMIDGSVDLFYQVDDNRELLKRTETADISFSDYVCYTSMGRFRDSYGEYSQRIKALARYRHDYVCVLESLTYGEDSYLDVENQIMNSIRIGEPTEVSSSPSSGVSTEVKEFVDGFESFFNKYVDVMKSIGKGSSDLSVLGEYATLLSEYADWMNKIEEFESKDMTAEDSKYFWDAYARVMNNLTSAGLSDN